MPRLKGQSYEMVQALFDIIHSSRYGQEPGQGVLNIFRGFPDIIQKVEKLRRLMRHTGG